MRREPVTAAQLVRYVEAIEEQICCFVGSGYNVEITYNVGRDEYRVYNHHELVTATSDAEEAAEAYNTARPKVTQR